MIPHLEVLKSNCKTRHAAFVLLFVSIWFSRGMIKTVYYYDAVTMRIDIARGKTPRSKTTGATRAAERNKRDRQQKKSASHHNDSLVSNDSPSDNQSLDPVKLPPAHIGSQYVKIIWMYWDQGLDHLESLNGTDSKYATDINCIRAAQILNPDWDMRFLDKQAAMKLAPKFAILAKDTSGRINVVKAANVLRLELLAKYGGVWIDTSLCLFRPLDEFIPSMVSSTGFYSKPMKKQGNLHGSELEIFKNCHKVEGRGSDARSNMNWFLVAAHPHHIIFEAWLDRLFDRMLTIMKASPAVTFPYFIAHCTFTQVRITNSTVERKWNKFMKSKVSRDQDASICIGGLSDCGQSKDPACESRRSDPEFVKQHCYLLKKPTYQLGEYVLSSSYTEYLESMVKNPITITSNITQNLSNSTVTS